VQVDLATTKLRELFGSLAGASSGGADTRREEAAGPSATGEARDSPSEGPPAGGSAVARGSRDPNPSELQHEVCACITISHSKIFLFLLLFFCSMYWAPHGFRAVLGIRGFHGPCRHLSTSRPCAHDTTKQEESADTTFMVL
jgi:hypothetical protein